MISKSNVPVIASSLWFQGLWFLAVIGRENTQVWLVVASVLTLLFCFVDEVKKLRLIFAVSALGILVDYINWQIGLFTFPSVSFPVWLTLLWGLFGWYAVQMRSLVNRYPRIFVSLLVGVSGSLSYFAGYRLGAVDWELGVLLTLSILFLEWFLLGYFVTKLLSSRWGML
ncbi:conserved hypothetical protein [Vibrio nigripulchritudo SFn27]|uniref:DUF2878 domain-containing protein n=1 Tax=Vibrio nigripulchritudo TaxID=28173 RepID=U4KG47_9VIBR|nr:DUF2878 domain-containing protein [Vibrio nigripulchritudo]CCN82791.1 conserved hypothetical protein [Vibrio nigripulchritudo BLFn1]CCN89941.1 conserved hypothetical protein [Vibrio nigripulchritudo SFn27]CCN92338.1 conserved hypothetical protein [Vibrio nigripulchritudo ENn2]CCO43825.1 conserved hypothetical protein [Vibrio nigripulchritudo SFn135]CCO53139.1 conserved hypothetical protein [Vibrio nigripulchritudo Wn13]